MAPVISSAAVLRGRDFATRGHVTMSVNIFDCSVGLQSLPVGRSQGCRSTCCRAQDSPHNKVLSRAKCLWCRGWETFLYIISLWSTKTLFFFLLVCIFCFLQWAYSSCVAVVFEDIKWMLLKNIWVKCLYFSYEITSVKALSLVPQVSSPLRWLSVNPHL